MQNPRPASIARIRPWSALLPVLLLAAALPGRSQETVPYLEAGVGRRQGDFTTSTTSTLWMSYLTCGVFGDRWDANLSLPYLRLQRSGGGASSRDQGLGDGIVRGLYRFLPETEDGWSLDGQAALKLATGKDAKGLGTGRTDLGGFLALHQQLGLFRWTVQAGRTQGTATEASSELRSGGFVWGLSGSWQFDGDRWTVAYESRAAAYQGLPGARELSLDLFHPISSRWGMKLSVAAGLSDGGPRQGIGLAFIRVFP